MATETTETIWLGGIWVRFLLEGDQTNGTMSMFEFGVQAGAHAPVAHSHDAYEETVYGLEGTLTWIVDGVEHEIGPGDAICTPRGVAHEFQNRSNADAKALAVATPGVLGPAYFREAAEVVAAAAGGPPDAAAIGAIMRRHGLTPVVA